MLQDCKKRHFLLVTHVSRANLELLTVKKRINFALVLFEPFFFHLCCRQFNAFFARSILRLPMLMEERKGAGKARRRLCADRSKIPLTLSAPRRERRIRIISFSIAPAHLFFLFRNDTVILACSAISSGKLHAISREAFHNDDPEGIFTKRINEVNKFLYD